MSRKWRNRGIILLVLIGITLIFRFTFFAPKPVEVSVYKVEAGPVEETVTNSKAGTVKVRRRANLSPEVGGRVVFLGVQEGQRVSKGQLLMRLDASDLEASLQLAERAAQAAEAAQKEACVAAELARRELQRNQELYRQGIVSEAILDQSQNRYESTQARCEASKAEARRARAQVDVTRANLKKTELRAPFNGIVVEVTAELGEYVTPSPPGMPIPPVIDMLDDSHVYVEAPIDETDAGKIQMGMPVRITLDPYPDRSFPGKVSRIAPFVRDIEGQNRTVDVEATFHSNPFSEKVMAGTSADMEIILKKKEKALRIPTYALMEGNRVFVVEKERVVVRKVKPGIRNWEFVEIQEGLKPGDPVIVSLERAEVKEGVPVKVVQEVKK